MKIKGSIALVTGANRGLGLAFAKALVEMGAAKVYAAARNPEAVTMKGVVPLKLDVTSDEDVVAAARAAGNVRPPERSGRRLRLPVPRRQLIQPMRGVAGDAGEDVSQPGLRIDADSSCTVMIRLYIAAARSPPRSEPQNSHDFLPSAIPRRPRSAALFDRQTRPSSRNNVKAGQRLRM